MTTVREQQTKCKGLRAYLVEWVNAAPGKWELGSKIVEAVQKALRTYRDIHTTGEVLAKELRKAQRKGEIRKRLRPGTVYVEYTAIGTGEGALFDFAAPTVHGVEVKARR